MSETNQEARRVLTEKRGAELDKWWAINFLRFMKFQDPISPTLSDLPIEILVQVLKKLKPVDRLICRKVCRSLRTAVKKCGFYFNCISLEVSNSNVAMRLNGLYIFYEDAANGASTVIYNKRETTIRGKNFMQVALKDLGILLKRARKFEFKIYRNLKEITIRFVPLIDICSILPYFNSQKLESIHLNCDDTKDHYENLTQLEQWQNAKYFSFYGSLGDNIPIQHLLHFKNITVNVNELSLRKVIEIKNKLLMRGTFEKCFLWLKNSNSIEIARVFQPTYSGSETFEIEYLSNNEKFEISCCKGTYLGEWQLIIERC